MDKETNISGTCFDHILFRLTGIKCDSQSIMRLNNEKLSVHGDLYFLTSFKFWKTILGNKLECHENCTDILQHYAHTRNVKTEQVETTKTNEEIVQSLISPYDDWDFRIRKFTLEKERVCLFLDRPLIMKNIIDMVIQKESSFGQMDVFIDESVLVSSQFDETSLITSIRLDLIKEVCKKILSLQGCLVNEETATRTIVLTSKSQAETSEKCDVYVCGVVKNSQTNSKEKTLTWEDYKNAKIENLTQLNEQKYFDIDKPDTNEKFFIEELAEASTNFELLSVKPSRPVFMNLHTDVDKSLTNTKGAPFILYNTARITAIINKFNTGLRNGEYPSLQHDEEIDFSVLNDEDEWELVYNFLIGYQEVIKNSIRLKPTLKICPHIICMFLSRLSQKFSIYYRRTKILTNGHKHLRMQVFARICMLKALHVVLKNALGILGMKPVSRM